MSPSQTISVGQLAERDGEGNVDNIDVRTPLEFRAVRAVVARNIPLDVLDPYTVTGTARLANRYTSSAKAAPESCQHDWRF